MAAQELLAHLPFLRLDVAQRSGNPAVAEGVVVIDESDLRLCLQRAAQAVGKQDPEIARVLGAHLLGTCGLLSDDERAAHYRELGGMLVELGQLYLTAATEPPGPAHR